MEIDTRLHSTKPSRPVLLNWERGVIKREKIPELKFNMSACTSNAQNKKKITIADNDENEFEGIVERSSEICNNFLLLRNKLTNKVTVYSADNYFMSKVKKVEERQSDDENEVNSKDANESKMDLYNLDQLFASKKTKRIAAERENPNINTDNVNARIDQHKNTNYRDISTESPARTSYLAYAPPCDRTATKIDDVYKKYDVFSKEVFDSLQPVAEQLANSSSTKLITDGWSEFVVKELLKKSPISVEAAKLIVIVDALLTYLRLPPRDLIKRDLEITDYSKELNKVIVDEFTTPLLPRGRCRPPTMRDKTICYLLVLFLMLNNYNIQLNALSNYTKVADFKRLPTLLQTIGAKKDKNIPGSYCLSLPLAQPPTIRKSMKN